jgi:alpha-galactosidase
MRVPLFLIAVLVGLTSARGAAPAAFNPWGFTTPFSFKYDGKDSAAFLSSWKRSESHTLSFIGYLRSIEPVYAYSFTDPATGLEISVQEQCDVNAKACDWLIRFKNTGTKDTPVLSDILSLDWTVSVNGQVTVHHPHGSKAEPVDFMPQDEALHAGTPLSFSSSNGRSSQGNMPFFNMQADGGGIVGAIGWTGDWVAKFTPAAEGKSVRMQAGLWQTHLVLHPGEEIRTPRIVLMSWQGSDWMVAQNAWRQLMLAHYTVRGQDAKPLVGPVSYGTWGADTAAHKLAQIALVKDEKLPFDNYWIDASWYDKCKGHDMGSDPKGPEAFYRGRGSWVINPANYPEGLKPISNAAHAAGMKFLLWFEPEEADPGTIWRTQHPDWFWEPPTGANEGTEVLKLGDPAVRAAMTNEIDKIITDNGIDWYRQDGNFDPRPTWSGHDTPDRNGMTEIRHIEGLYAFWDELHRRHPNLLIDNCASGGQRIDIETTSRSTPLWRSDMAGPRDSEIHNQTQTQGLAPWVPVNGCCPWTTPGPFDESQVPPDVFTAKLIYGFRSGYSAAMVVGIGQPQGKDAAWCAQFRAQLEEYKEVQPYIYGDFYPLTPWTSAPDAQVAWQWDRPDKRSGVIIALRRAGCASDEIGVNVRSIDPNATYAVEIRTGLSKTTAQMMKGVDLAALKIKIADQPGSALVFYTRE